MLLSIHSQTHRFGVVGAVETRGKTAKMILKINTEKTKYDNKQRRKSIQLNLKRIR